MDILNSRLKMKRYKGNIDMSRVARRLTVCCLLLLSFAGHTMAQEDGQFVIKKDNHYLSHVKVNGTWVLKDMITFEPDSCLWYSGTEFNSSGLNHNYYFVDGDNYHFLSAPLEPNASLSYSASLPYTYLLRNRDGIYYFYDWDSDPYGRGVARAYQYTDQCAHDSLTCVDSCGHSWGYGECWEVYWVEFRDNAWKLSDSSSYNITEYAARYRGVEITETITVQNESGLRELKADNVVIPPTGIVMEYSGDRDRALSARIETPYEYTVQTNYRFEGTDHLISRTGNTNLTSSPYHWTISGDAEAFLSFNESGSASLTSTSATPILYYRTENLTGDKTATLTLTVTYLDGSTQTLTTTVLVKTDCQNPQLAAQPVVNHSGVTVSWCNTNAEAYKLWWRKKNTGEWASIEKGTATSHFFPASILEYETTYEYWISASCGGSYLDLPDGTDPFEFTTMPEPGLVVHGAVYGGGRMADVTGNTEVVVINCDSIGGVYGGNDIAGAVQGEAGSKIQLGVNDGDVNYASMGVTHGTITISSVYGGGNGFYTYDGNEPGAAIGTTVLTDGTFSSSVTDVGGSTSYMESGTIPTIIKTDITVANDFVKVDSVFGGARNAFLTLDAIDQYGSSITVNGGTLFAVFGGNNVGGTVKRAKHHIQVNQTTTLLEENIVSTATTGSGRDFGIRYLFGGGNKVAGSTTDIHIAGGQMDTVFGGGNMADVTAAYMFVDCEPAAGSGNYTYGNIYSNAIQAYYPANTNNNNTDSIVIKADYAWDGMGIYNIHTLFGGNNRAAMYGVPHITLTSGSIGTAYGGGNAGDMKASVSGQINTFINHTHRKNIDFNYGTKIEVASPDVVVDYLYGGCQVSNVDYSTFVDIKDGHIGSVYGGCNVSGDVGSTQLNPDEPGPSGADYQAVMGGTYVRATGGTVYEAFFGGSNGFYHCNDGTRYKAGVDYGDPEQQYIGMLVPTHNETHLFIGKDEQHPNGVTIKGDAYTGGNLACVGFTNFTVPYINGGYLDYPEFVGLSSLHMEGGRVEGSVYGGGRMASVYGSNEVKVDGGYIGGALYGGNDRTGQVAQITNRVWPINDNYTVASDSCTSLATVHTYVGITGNPHINTVYGGGNGDYIYEGEGADMEYCLSNDQPIQSNTFVDVHIVDEGHINTVYGGGNGVTVTGAITVFLNVVDPTPGIEHVGTIFGGNNKGSLDILSDIVLLHGQVQTVYGGCNKGAMLGSQRVRSGDNSTWYENVGSFVRLRNQYPGRNNTTVIPDAVVSGAVYGGCRMNGVTNNSLVLVEGGIHTDTTMIFGGSDISGDVRGTTTSTSQVVLTAGTHSNGPLVGDVFGGGNGNYYYSGNKVYYDEGLTQLIDTVKTGTIQPPYSRNSRVDMSGGTASNLFAGGYKGSCGITEMQVDGGNVVNSMYGGGMKAGVVKTYAVVNSDNSVTNINTAGTSTITVDGGSVGVGIYGGSNLEGTIEGDIAVNIHASLGSATDSVNDGIYGGGYGPLTRTNGNVTVTVDKKENSSLVPVLYSDVYGGSAFGTVNNAGAATPNLTHVVFNDGELFGVLYGGGKGGSTAGASDSTLVNGNVQVDINKGTLYSGIYGGCNAKGNVVGDIAVNVNGGTIGFNGETVKYAADVFGGGYGQRTSTTGNVAVTIDKTGSVAPVIYGDVYGGSGLGKVNNPGATQPNTTTVTVLDGSIMTTTINGTTYGGNVYGGGLGSEDIEALVYGKVYVYIGNDERGNATIGDAVYGCNNINGSPQDSVFVHIYHTAHGIDAAHNLYPPTPEGGWTLTTLANNELIQDYAIRAVYGGGNKAAYIPPLTSAGLARSTTVHVHYCTENTVRDVYGGGNAADVGITDDLETTEEDESLPVNTRIIIDGGRINRMFGGGNGYSAATPPNHTNPDGADYNPGANIYGKASSYVYAGLIDEVYGGANQWGSIDTINLNVLSNECANTHAVFRKVFGCANEAPINHDIVTTIGCDVGEIGELYGGSNLADIGSSTSLHPANVTLNVYDGDYLNVFGGSKGDRTAGTHADIYGNVTLNIYGGTIVKAFGGSDQLGNVFGAITVNVDTTNSGCHPMVLDTVFGAGNLTYYKPNTVDGNLITSPIVNIKNGTVRQAVFGGGLGATAITTANPQVNIGDTTSTVDEKIARVGYMVNNGGNISYVGGDVYGGGYAGDVKGAPEVNILKENTIVYNEVYGGGDFANIDSTFTTKVNVVDGTIKKAIYGGCHNTGNVRGDIEVNIYGDTLGTPTENITIHGGGLGQPTTTTGNVTVNIGGGNYTPTIYGNVYGGSALGKVNNIDEPTNRLTKVDLKTGTVHGTVYGGGLGNRSSNIPAWVYGNVEVYANGSTVDTIFGCNDQLGAPRGTVTVTVNDGTVGYVFGGGDLANYTAPTPSGSEILYSPYVLTNGGWVTDMILGGGNAANIYGNTKVELIGGTIGSEGSATVPGHPASVFGGGLGEGTQVEGQVLVNFGKIYDDTLTHTTNLVLYGDLYGGSALGDVNRTDHDDDVTTVNLLNGKIASYHALTSHNTDTILDSRVFGGGLGSKTDNIAASVNGTVHVNVGYATDAFNDSTFVGQADLVGCDVYGGNNQLGTPKKLVFVDVYQTYHTEKDSANYIQHDATFAVDEVFGGGNEADYEPGVVGAKVYVYVHLCKNTIRRVFGGGNAAYVPGVDLTIDGGRFDEVYGGGNGELGPDHAANVGSGGIYILLGGGRIRLLVNGSNDFGSVDGTIISETMPVPVCSESVIEDYFLGNNHTDLFEDIEATIYCGDQNGIDMRFVNLYCGSNQAKQYGNINVTIEGGVFEHVYGGSKGDSEDLNTPEDPNHTNFAADIKIITDSLVATHPELASRVGDGGNITLTIKGGTIGDLYGGSNVNGNIEGKISITVHDIENSCGLFIGNIYGASNQTNYTPKLPDIVSGVVSSPEIKISKATIGGRTSDLPINNPDHLPDTLYLGNVYGGGHFGHVNCNPKVIVGNGTDDPVTIEGNVFGGGSEGNVNGSPVVLVVPTTQKLYYDETLSMEEDGGVIRVTSMIGSNVPSGTMIGEGHDVRLKAIPSVYGYTLDHWSVLSGDGHIADTTMTSTLFTMGKEETTIAVLFKSAPVNTFTYLPQPEHGTIAVTDGLEQNVASGSNISEGAVLNLKATPASNDYVFVGWTVTSGNGIIKNVNSSETEFIMRDQNTTITATFRSVR